MKRSYLANYLQIVPIVAFLVLAALLLPSPDTRALEPPLLLAFLNTALLSALPFIFAFFSGRICVREGRLEFMLLGCGMVAFGTGSLLAGWGLTPFSPNFAVTVHNLGAALGGLCHLGAVAMLVAGESVRVFSRRTARCTVVAGYSACVLAILAISILTAGGVFPVFFVQGQGPTAIRQAVLAIAVGAFALSAIAAVDLHARTGERLFRSYASALFLTAVGLGIGMIQKNVGSLVGWTGRVAQYAGSAFFAAAVLTATRSRRKAARLSLPAYLHEILQSQIADEVRSRTLELTELNRSLRLEVAEREKAEAELRRSEESYRTVADFTYDWELWLDPEGRVKYCSPSCERITGYSRQEFMEDPGLLTRIVSPEEPSGTREHFKRADPGSPESFEFRIRSRSGELRWIGHVCQPVFSDDGAFLGRRASNRDLTDHKRLDIAYRSLIDLAPYGMAIVKAGRLIFANPTLADITGESAYQLREWRMDELLMRVVEEDRERVASHVTAFIAKRTVSPVLSFGIIHRNGTARWIETRLTRIGHDGSPALQLMFKDVTAEKSAEDELKESRQKMRNLAGHLLHAREEEGRRIAQEIHDELGQTLTALKMDMH